MKFISVIVAYILLSLFVYIMQKWNIDSLATITHSYENSEYLIEGASYAVFPFIQCVIFSIFFVILSIMSRLSKNVVLILAVFSCTLAFATLLIISSCCYFSEDFFSIMRIGCCIMDPASVNQYYISFDLC